MYVVSTKFAKALFAKVNIVMSQTAYISNNDHHMYVSAQCENLVGGIQSSSRPGHHQTSASHWVDVTKTQIRQ